MARVRICKEKKEGETHQLRVRFPHWRGLIRRGRRFFAPQQLRTQPEILCEEYAKDEVPRAHRREIERRRVVLYTDTENRDGVSDRTK